MASEFSDPAWWPTPPPEPPRTVSMTKVVFGTLVPIAAGVLILVVVLNQRHHHTAVDSHSYAAFQACFEAQGGDSPAARTNTRLLQEDAEACQDHLPPGTKLPSLAATLNEQAAQEAFQKCMQAATANLRRGFGGGGFGSRFGSSSGRQAFEKAVALCQAVSTPTKPARKTPAPPT